MSKQLYQLRPLDLDDQGLSAITELLKSVFPKADHFTEEVIHWQYLKNPDGQAVGFNAWSGDVLAGHYVTIPLKAEVFGVEEKGLLSLNTATHEDHRGKGLFTKLAHATYEKAAADGYKFVVGVANANSTHGFVTKLGFQLVSPLRAMVGIGPLRMKRSRAELEFKPLWSSAKMAWRTAHPMKHYTRYQIAGHEFMLSDTELKGFHFMMSTNRDIPSTMLADATIPIRKAYVGLDPDMNWSGTLYMNVPKRFRQAPLNLIYKDLTGQNRKLDAKKVRFQALDFDTL